MTIGKDKKVDSKLKICTNLVIQSKTNNYKFNSLLNRFISDSADF